MSSSLLIPTTDETKEDAKYNKICKEYKHLITTLPKANGWRVQYLYSYHGFWIDLYILQNTLLLNAYFKSQPTDIYLASFMKSGTTWLKALMFSIVNRHRSDPHLLNHGPHSIISNLEVIDQTYPFTDDFSNTNLSPPRLFGTHLAHTVLPPCITSTSCKLVYVCRDPKDVFVSKWHFMKNIRSKDLAPLSLDEAFELFCQGISEFGPFWEHVLSYWRASLESPEKILFLKYEEMKKQPAAEVRKLAAFMGRPFMSEEEEKGMVGKIVELCSFEKLSNLEVNKTGFENFGKGTMVDNRHFFRKGEIGDWKNYLSEAMKERIDKITEDKFKGSDLIIGPTL